MNWGKLPPLDPAKNHVGCLTCHWRGEELPIDAHMAIGFGSVIASCDGEIVWSGDDPEKKVSEIEELALKDPERDWRIQYDGPLSGQTYQRHAPGKWILIASNEGFA